MAKKEKNKYKQSIFFKGYKGFIKLFKKKPTFKYVGEKIAPGSLILSNHEGTSAPLAFELFLNEPIRFWGAYQMNGSLVSLYKYQTKQYYHEKKHWPLWAARLFCLLASPLTWFFYRGLNLIPIYPGSKLRTTLKESIQTIKDKRSIVIYPEDSSEGYLPVLKGFHAGFVLLANECLKAGIDLPIHVAYINKKEKVYVIDNPILYSSLVNEGLNKEQICEKLCARMNEIAKLATNEPKEDSNNKNSELSEKKD